MNAGTADRARGLPPRLVALTPGNVSRVPPPEIERRAQLARRGGLSGLLLREPELSDREVLSLAAALREIVDESGGGWLGLHDRAHLALAARAEAVHLGFRSLSPAEIRGWLEERCAIGLSAHAGDAGERWRCADYLFFGPVRETASKQGLLPATGFAELARGVERSDVPVWAIGGLSAEDAPAVLRAGARGMAVLSGILLADDPEAAASAFARAFEQHTIP